MATDGQKHHLTDTDRATAVGRVLAGESRRKVAKEMGVSDATVRRWMAQAESRETAQGQTLADRAQKIAEEIGHWEEIARHTLIRRIAELGAETKDLAAAANAYRRVSEQVQLAKGKPTSITGTASSDVDDAIERLLRKHDEAEQGASTNGHR